MTGVAPTHVIPASLDNVRNPPVHSATVPYMASGNEPADPLEVVLEPFRESDPALFDEVRDRLGEFGEHSVAALLARLGGRRPYETPREVLERFCSEAFRRGFYRSAENHGGGSVDWDDVPVVSERPQVDSWSDSRCGALPVYNLRNPVNVCMLALSCGMQPVNAGFMLPGSRRAPFEVSSTLDREFGRVIRSAQQANEEVLAWQIATQRQMAEHPKHGHPPGGVAAFEIMGEPAGLASGSRAAGVDSAAVVPEGDEEANRVLQILEGTVYGNHTLSQEIEDLIEACDLSDPASVSRLIEAVAQRLTNSGAFDAMVLAFDANWNGPIVAEKDGETVIDAPGKRVVRSATSEVGSVRAGRSDDIDSLRSRVAERMGDKHTLRMLARQLAAAMDAPDDRLSNLEEERAGYLHQALVEREARRSVAVMARRNQFGYEISLDIDAEKEWGNALDTKIKRATSKVAERQGEIIGGVLMAPHLDSGFAKKYVAATGALHDLMDDPEFLAIRISMDIAESAHVLVTKSGHVGALNKSGAWTTLDARIAAVAALAQKAKLCVDSVQQVGRVRSNGNVSLRDVLAYYQAGPVSDFVRGKAVVDELSRDDSAHLAGDPILIPLIQVMDAVDSAPSDASGRAPEHVRERLCTAIEALPQYAAVSERYTAEDILALVAPGLLVEGIPATVRYLESHAWFELEQAIELVHGKQVPIDTVADLTFADLISLRHLYLSTLPAPERDAHVDRIALKSTVEMAVRLGMAERQPYEAYSQETLASLVEQVAPVLHNEAPDRRLIASAILARFGRQPMEAEVTEYLDRGAAYVHEGRRDLPDPTALYNAAFDQFDRNIVGVHRLLVARFLDTFHADYKTILTGGEGVIYSAAWKYANELKSREAFNEKKSHAGSRAGIIHAKHEGKEWIFELFPFDDYYRATEIKPGTFSCAVHAHIDGIFRKRMTYRNVDGSPGAFSPSHTEYMGWAIDNRFRDGADDFTEHATFTSGNDNAKVIADVLAKDVMAAAGELRREGNLHRTPKEAAAKNREDISDEDYFKRLFANMIPGVGCFMVRDAGDAAGCGADLLPGYGKVIKAASSLKAVKLIRKATGGVIEVMGHGRPLDGSGTMIVRTISKPQITMQGRWAQALRLKALEGTSQLKPDAETLRHLGAEMKRHPAPPLLRVVEEGENEHVVVATLSDVSIKRMFDGSEVLTVRGQTYRRSADGDRAFYVRGAEDDVMQTGCARTKKRAIESLVCAPEGLFLRSQHQVDRRTLPALGTDTPGEGWTPWVSDVRVYGTPVPVPVSRKTPVPAWARDLRVVPYDGAYHKLEFANSARIKLRSAELRELGLPQRPSYQGELGVSVRRRQGHAAEISVDTIDPALPGSRLEAGASVFEELSGSRTWFVTQYDGTWYQASFPTAANGKIPSALTLRKAPDTLSDMERALQRGHAGMQNANFQAKIRDIDDLEQIMEINSKLGLDEPVRGVNEYFKVGTTGPQAFLFDRPTRNNVLIKRTADAGYTWKNLEDPEVDANLKNGHAKIFGQVFVKSQEDLLPLASDRKFLNGKNFAIFIVNNEEVYIGFSGNVPRHLMPRLFGTNSKAKVMLHGRRVDATFINNDKNLKRYVRDMRKDTRYPRPLPTAATAEDLAKPSTQFDVTAPRDFDSEQKVIAFLEYGGRQGKPPIREIDVFNRNDACKSCAPLLQTFFKDKEKVTHVFVNEYVKF
jgi:hypothetical protein